MDAINLRSIIRGALRRALSLAMTLGALGLFAAPVSQALPLAGADPAAVDFGEWHTTMAASAVPVDVTLTNNGDQDLVFTSIDFSEATTQFKFAASPDATPLAPGSSRVISLLFTPSEAGPQSATLRIASNAADSPTLDIPLSGLGYAGVLSISGPTSANESGLPIIDLVLDAPSTREISVNYTITPGTATDWQDFVAGSGTVVFLPGETQQSVFVDVMDDYSDEPDETVNVAFSDAVGIPDPIPSSITYTILDDDDPPEITFVQGASIGPEGLAMPHFEVILSQPSAYPITVNAAPIGGTATPGVDFTSASTTLTFNPGDIHKLLPLTVARDALIEPNETVQLGLSEPVSATLGAQSTHEYFITDDLDLATVQFMTSSSPESVSRGSIMVSLTQVYDDPVQVSYAVIQGNATRDTDYVLPDGVLQFAPGEQSQIIAFQVLEDALSEEDEFFTVALYNPAGVDASFGVGHKNTYTYRILDNDPQPTVQFSLASSSGPETQAAAPLDVLLSAPTGRAVTVGYSVTGGSAASGSDFTLANGTLTFAAGESSKSIPLAVINDADAETDETVQVTLTTASGANLGLQTAHDYTILDDE